MDAREDVAWELRSKLGGDKYRLDHEKAGGAWLERVVSPDNKLQSILVVECGGSGIAQRLKEAGKRARELGVPFKVINGIQAATDWACGHKSECGNKPVGNKRLPPVRWLDMDEMDAWLERNFPRRRQSWC